MHSHDDQLSGQKFFFVTVLNVLITLVEFFGGLLSGSLSLLSDAVHNLGDSASVVMSYWAHRVSLRPQNQKNTFGFKRAQIISAFLNSIFLLVLSLFLIIEAVKKIITPEKIDGSLMFVVAVVGMIANLVSAVMLNRGSKHNLNMRATYLHLLSDSLSSFGIIIAGILIQLFNWTIADPLVTIIVAVYISIETWNVVKKTVTILMQGSANLDYEKIQADIMKIDGVIGIHHVHSWMIDENSVIFSAHVNVNDMLVSEAEHIYVPINKLLKNKYGVDHVTIQIEVHRGRTAKLFNDGKHVS